MADNVVTVFDLNINPATTKIGQLADELDALNQKFDNVGNPFREAAKGASDFEKNLTADTKKVAELEAITSALTEEVKRLNVEHKLSSKIMKEAADGKRYKEAKTQVKELKEEIKKLNKELENTSKRGKDATSIMSRIKGGFLGAFTGFATGGGAGVQGAAAVLGAINPVLGVTAGLLGSLASKAFEATSQWQGYEVALKNSLGSQQLATQNLSVLEELAVRLPVGLNEVTEAFNQLVNRGFKPAKDELSNLSGFAAAQNKSFDQLIQAILDAEQGELERLKEFGIQASNEGGKVSITFRGITKTFEKGARDSVSAFADLARELGSDALNADKMQTLAGRMSNLSDQSDRIARKFGEVLLPVFEAVLSVSAGLLDVIDKAVTGWTDFDKILKQTSGTAENTYPNLERLFSLFTIEGFGQTVKDFFFSVNAGLEKILASSEALIGMLSNPGNFAAIGLALAQWRQNMDNINKSIDKYYSTDPTKRGAGDFVYQPGGGGAKPGPTEAEIKAAQKRARELAELEAKLKAELLKIENEYGKEKLEALKDNELEYIEAKRKYDIERINQEQAALLKLKQIVSGARKGMYDKNGKVIADTSAQLTTAETAPFDFRRQLVDDEAAKDRAKFINDAEKEITQVLSNEYQRQLQDVEYKYEKLFELARKSGVDITKLEKEKQKELAKINSDKDIADLEKKSLQEQGDAELNVIRAQIEGRTGLEIEARAGLLEIEKKYLLEKIKLIEVSGDPEAEARIAAIKKVIAQVDLELKDLADKDKDRKGIGRFLADSLGMNDNDIDEAIQAAELFSSKMQTVMSDLYSTLNRLSEQRIQRIDDEIAKKEDQVEKEKELNEEGTANNLNLRLKELADLKSARERAIEDQKRLQRTQLIVDTASQASSMITAASKVYSGFAGIPIVGVGLGIAAVALMLGAFAAAKIKAFQLVNQQAPQFKKGGRHGGRLHSEGGELVEVERDEWTINRRSSMEHDSLLEAINNNDKAGMLDYMLNNLLDGTGVTMSDRERTRERAWISYYQKKNQTQEKELLNEVKAMREELEQVKKNTSNIPEWTMVPLGDNKIMKEHNKSKNRDVIDLKKFVEKN